MIGCSTVIIMPNEEDLNRIVKEYLELGEYTDTLRTFNEELKKADKTVPEDKDLPSVAERIKSRQQEMISLFDQGRRREFFEAWEESIPQNMRDTDSLCQRLEFYLQIHFTVFLLRSENCKAELAEEMNQYKLFLESRGAQLSQTTEFLPYYALPFIPNPKEHPSFRDLFQASWMEDLRTKLETFLTTALKAGLKSKLSELVIGEQTLQTQLQQALSRTAELTRTLASNHRRFRKIREDYQKLIGLASELISSLEQAVRGDLVDIDSIMNLYSRSFPEVFGQLYHGTTVPLSIYNGPTSDSEFNNRFPDEYQTSEFEFQPLDFAKIKQDLVTSPPHTKAVLLQALRWRLTLNKVANHRAEVLATYIIGDLLGCNQPNQHRRVMLNLLTSHSEEVHQSACRLLNSFASFREGRLYLAHCPEFVTTLQDNLMRRRVDGITMDMSLATLQKLSLRHHHQTAMIEGGMVEWLLGILEDHDSLSDYSLEYAVALLMNLCLRSAGKQRCANSPRRVLTVLTDLLGNQNQEIIPYVNGALYSVLSLAPIKEEAKAMAMEDILRCFIKDGSSEMKRQLEFILKQLTTDNPDEQNSDEEDKDEEDEDDDDDDENQDFLEEDLDRDDCVQAAPGELVGEKFLSAYYLKLFPVNSVPKSKKRTGTAKTEVLTRPATPGSRPLGESYSAPVGPVKEPENVIPPTISSAPSSSKKKTEIKTEKKPNPVSSAGNMKGKTEQDSGSDSRPSSAVSPPRTPNYSVDVTASEVVCKITGMKKVLAEATNSPVPPKTRGPTADEYVIAFSTRPKIPRTPEHVNYDSTPESPPSSQGSTKIKNGSKT